jgi:hypothetical protein
VGWGPPTYSRLEARYLVIVRERSRSLNDSRIMRAPNGGGRRAVRYVLENADMVESCVFWALLAGEDHMERRWRGDSASPLLSAVWLVDDGAFPCYVQRACPRSPRGIANRPPCGHCAGPARCAARHRRHRRERSQRGLPGLRSFSGSPSLSPRTAWKSYQLQTWPQRRLVHHLEDGWMEALRTGLTGPMAN